MTDPGEWILVVDDDDDIRYVIAIVLDSVGYRVVEAANGAEALGRLQADGAPALILLDLRMPVLSGPDFLRVVKATPALARIPVVIMSGDGGARATSVALGAEACLTKPIELDDLIDTVSRVATATPKT